MNACERSECDWRTQTACPLLLWTDGRCALSNLQSAAGILSASSSSRDSDEATRGRYRGLQSEVIRLGGANQNFIKLILHPSHNQRISATSKVLIYTTAAWR